MEKKTVSLVLTSGGARGLAQIGAIDALLEEGFEIKAVSGSSIGSLIGGLYTVKKLHLYKDWIQDLGKMDVFNLLDFTFSGNGFIKGEKVLDAMDKIFGDSIIERDGHIPFTAVATDLMTRKEVWIQKGSLFQAIRASCAIPSVVTPHAFQDRILIDGGVVSPAPFEPVANENNDLTIIINVNGTGPYQSPFRTAQEQKKEQNEYLRQLAAFRSGWSKYFPKTVKTNNLEKHGYMSLLNKSIEFMTERLIEYAIKHHQPDIVIEISRESGSMFEFFKAKELMAAGREAALKAIDDYRNTAKDEDDQENHLREVRSIIG